MIIWLHDNMPSHLLPFFNKNILFHKKTPAQDFVTRALSGNKNMSCVRPRLINPTILCLFWYIVLVCTVHAISECMGKTFQAATTNSWELFDPTSLLQNIFFISAKLNFHRPLVCSTICRVQYYTPEVGGSSVWQISKKYFAGVM